MRASSCFVDDDDDDDDGGVIVGDGGATVAVLAVLPLDSARTSLKLRPSVCRPLVVAGGGAVGTAGRLFALPRGDDDVVDAVVAVVVVVVVVAVVVATTAAVDVEALVDDARRSCDDVFAFASTARFYTTT